MFSKTAEPTSAPTASTTPPRPAAPGGNAGRSVLGADLRITGEITTTGSVEVLGEIDGTLTAHGLIIGAEGRVTGSVTADTVEVKGKLDGKVACETFTLRATARVKADITTSAVVIESGAEIEGRFLKRKA
jgi:cytoskeletal protein CcmA (bactofilin family)